MNPAELSSSRFASPRIQRTERLVEQEDGRTPRQRPRERHELSLAAGERLHRPVAQIPGPDPSGDLSSAITVRRSVRDVLLHGEVWEQVPVLIHEPELTLLRRDGQHVAPVQQEHTCRVRVDAGDRFQQRRLSGPGWPDHDAVRPLWDHKRHVLETKRPRARGKAPGLDHARAPPPRSGRRS